MPTSSPLAVAGLRAYGALQLGQGAWMAAAPGTFYDAIGPFGPRNEHYVRDAATWSLALGVVCLLAAARPAWRLPVLALAALQAGLHTVNHLVDAGLPADAFIGIFDAVALALLTGLLLLAVRQEVAR